MADLGTYPGLASPVFSPVAAFRAPDTSEHAGCSSQTAGALFEGIQEIHIDHPAISWQRHMGAVGFETIQSMHAFSVSLCGKLRGSSSDWQCDGAGEEGHRQEQTLALKYTAANFPRDSSLPYIN